MKPIKRIAISEDAEKFYIPDLDSDYHTKHGAIRKEDIISDTAKTNIGRQFFLFDPAFIDKYERIRRGAQIITLKDIGHIIAYCGIGKGTRVVDAGSGSGALACILGHVALSVITYDIRDDHIELVRENIEMLGLDNVQVKKKDVYSGIDEEEIDVLTLDLPEPWKAIEALAKNVKRGGFAVTYCPTVPQVMDAVLAATEKGMFVHTKTCELIERDWEVTMRRVRPKTVGLNHTGFLSFFRRA